jgi:hypothetical protein
LASCLEEEIRHYRVPKVDTSRRLLAAIFPQGDRTWFFKLVGPPQDVEEHKEEFDRFVRSVRFTNKAEQPVTWTVPDTWQKEPGSKLRYATFRVLTKDASLELSVTPLDGRAGSVLNNVNRWRQQIGLEPITAAELGKSTQEEKIAGLPVTLVDVTGPSEAVARKRSPQDVGAAGLAANESSGPAISYDTPAGWEKSNPSGPIRAEAAFRVTEGGKSAEVTVTRLPGTAGGLVENVKRWRSQIKLGPIREEELLKDIRDIQVAGLPAAYVDLFGSQSAGGERILGVVVEQTGQTWFFKMKGPADLVGKQKSAFEAFLGSLRFDGSRGANE